MRSATHGDCVSLYSVPMTEIVANVMTTEELYQ